MISFSVSSCSFDLGDGKNRLADLFSLRWKCRLRWFPFTDFLLSQATRLSLIVELSIMPKARLRPLYAQVKLDILR
jgi:hypothetical protein